MSIESILAATTHPASAEKVGLADWIFIAVGVLAVPVAGWFGAFRPRKVVGPERIPANRAAWPLALVLGLAIFGYFFGSALFILMKEATQLHPKEALHTTAPAVTAADLTAADWAILSVLPPAVAFLCLILGDFVVDRSAIAWLGFRPQRAAGLLRGLAVGLLAIPFVNVLLMAVQIGYEYIGYQHPQEHDLLRVMGQSRSPLVEWTLIVGAVVVAPVFEELLFRGHLQTLLRQGLIRVTTRRRDPIDDPMTNPPGVPPNAADPEAGLPLAGPWIIPPPASPAAAPVGEYAGASPAPSEALPALGYEPLPPARPPVWQTWTAILLTALAFGSVHPLWTFPAIFTLAVILGYLYERTGNLWVPIGLHATFNAASTVLYLSQSHGR